eukprot:6197160-Pleurochrysis_carterae.AAC.2
MNRGADAETEVEAEMDVLDTQMRSSTQQRKMSEERAGELEWEKDEAPFLGRRRHSRDVLNDAHELKHTLTANLAENKSHGWTLPTDILPDLWFFYGVCVACKQSDQS